MDYHRLYRELRAELREWVREYTATFIKLLPYTNSTASGEHDKVQGYDTEGSDEEPYDFEGRRVYPFGIRSRPPKGVLGLWIGNRGRSGNGAIIGAESSRFGPSDLKDGEVAIYCKINGALFKLDEHGAAALLAAAGQVVSINGTTYKMPQWDDGAGGGYVAALLTFLTALHTAASFANIIAAADTFKNAIQFAANFSSTKAKNG